MERSNDHKPAKGYILSPHNIFNLKPMPKCTECGWEDPDQKLFHELDVNGRPELLCNVCYTDYIQDQEDRYGEPQEQN